MQSIGVVFRLINYLNDSMSIFLTVDYHIAVSLDNSGYKGRVLTHSLVLRNPGIAS
jgi:hypothetical protein